MGLCGSSVEEAPDSIARRSLPSVLLQLREAYEREVVQVGYTDGHVCISDRDKVTASEHGASLLYGELLPEGAFAAAAKLSRGH